MANKKPYQGMAGWEYSDTILAMDGDGFYPALAAMADGDGDGDGIPGGKADRLEAMDYDGLNTYTVVTAERRLTTDSIRARAGVMAGILAVDADELTAYIGKLAHMVRQADRQGDAGLTEELEQHLWAGLLARQDGIRGNWERVKVAASWGYRDWYARRSGERELSTNAERRAISLERARFREMDESGELEIPDTVEMEAPFEGELHIKALLSLLPPLVADVIGKRLTDTPTNSTERNRLARFLAVPQNIAGIKAALTGEMTGKPKWKLSNGKKGRPKNATVAA